MTRRVSDADLHATHPLTQQARGAEGGLYLTVTATRPNPTSRVVTFNQDPETLVFGRSAESQVVLAHEGVSRRHAQFTRRGNQISVEDAGSTNGTLVNGVPIAGPRRLAAGDVVTLGTVTIVLVATSAVRDRRHIATITELEDRLDAEVERARRYGRMLALVMLRVTGPTEVVEPHLTSVVRTLRRMDLLADYGGDELGLLLPEADPAAIDAVLARIAQVPPMVTVTAGAASFPRDGASAGELISRAHERLRGDAPGPTDQTQVVIADPKMQHVFMMVERVAASPINVLLLGESGVGKEVVADAIHARSPRAMRPMVRLNCGALPEALLESELFGHVEGAFTGAVADKPGLFERANGGTVFLDEVGDLAPPAQAKLLRVIDQRRVMRVGDVQEQAVDVRIICATHYDLEAEVRRGRFREDLFFRIGVFTIVIPPLRDRRSEIEPLARRFASELARGRPITFTAETLAALDSYDWPGNVRELRNAIERALVLGGTTIEPEHLPERVLAATSTSAGSNSNIRQRVANVERQVIVDALVAADGRQSAAARALGISRFALARLMEKHGLRKK